MANSLASKTKFRFVFLTPSLFYKYDIPSIFRKCLQSYYGDQTKALRKILLCEDRTCELLLKGQTQVGLLVYKDSPQSEFKKDGLTNYLEIKTLLVIDSEKHPRQRLGSRLLMRACEVALEKEASSIFVTVSSGCVAALAFFLHHGFRCFELCPDLYQKGLQEHFLIHSDLNLLKEQIAETMSEVNNGNSLFLHTEVGHDGPY